ncbi:MULTISPECIES: rhomboid family intramembrane serine protease [Pseudoalteromonas]|uniref:rhomboid family intramembrane serine protease n=1 Tax=Pseudoalteromonas TaxID=53246 RepID=UPI00097F6088|nr:MULTISPECIES: rhomboid family intramembrane serine protease [Pseudoalteromonas]MBH0093097.1 rhomboid family intramembrane serine protease [Pseudoalteromonas sp. SCQQ13]PCC12296.1 rhomboid family intramembrane serine protease [Pseudoalteromonas sp. JB197]SJN48994.1 putative rhomboid family protein [Pseudoalteromonas sp. JB197]
MATTRSLLTSKRFAIFSIVTICFVLQLINSLPGINLNGFGIYPRSINGLIGILSAPFLHGSWWHFASNMLPFMVLSWLICQYSVKRFYNVFIFTALVGGFLVWALGRSNIHVGLSGVIYGLWGFILCYGVIRRSFKSIVIAVVVALLYSGFVWGVLPQRLHISFESHLFGALSGLFLGYKLAKSDKLKSQKTRL